MAPPVPEEYVQIVGVPSPLPVAWLEGDVLAEYLQFLEEAEEAAPLPGVKWLEGDVLANFLQFLGEDEPEPVAHYGSSSGGGSGSNGGGLVDEEEDDDEEMAFLLRHITSLPAVMARAAAATAVQD